ncbi:hypothetical protein NDN01_00370 [Sphingomonas sp. QA11]|uniref:hypothetical protein n=1 Tax=Sphingomonas sp. QA11 TaxID=2950605 RepID=UPI00234BF677|nr:hypothetical protein [Sphingomonas sp. QA11]WCM27429.1 hypothetical protein NDN01_00370 [Sphingomonas sp. QA11]
MPLAGPSQRPPRELSSLYTAGGPVRTAIRHGRLLRGAAEKTAARPLFRAFFPLLFNNSENAVQTIEKTHDFQLENPT